MASECPAAVHLTPTRGRNSADGTFATIHGSNRVLKEMVETGLDSPGPGVSTAAPSNLMLKARIGAPRMRNFRHGPNPSLCAGHCRHAG